VVLRAGQAYSVDAQPTEPGVDFDLHVFDENGDLVDQDVSPASDRGRPPRCPGTRAGQH